MSFDFHIHISQGNLRDNLVASGVQMEAWSVEDCGQGVCFHVFCYNVQPGIEIDYKTGDSWLESVSKNDLQDNQTITQGEINQYILNTNSHRIHKPDCDSVNDPCDWEKSKELLLILFEEGSDVDQALAANTLGYIYYYGRCNGGTPQYEEAFKYFSIGAFFGVDESTYKIGDMFLNGKGVPKNRTTARHLYHKVYDTTLPNFEDGVLTGKFADAALRLGGYYEKGSEENLMLAYTYYLEACFAINCRTAVEYNYGDSVVARRVREGLERVKHSLIESETINENATEECRNIVNTIRILTEGDYKLAARLKEEGEEYKLTLIRVNDEEEDEDVCPALITFPDIGIVRLLKEINLYLEDADVIEGIECLEDTRIGYVDYHVDRGLELHDADGELILRVSSPIARVKKLDFYSLYD